MAQKSRILININTLNYSIFSKEKNGGKSMSLTKFV